MIVTIYILEQNLDLIINIYYYRYVFVAVDAFKKKKLLQFFDNSFSLEAFRMSAFFVST